MIFGKQKFDVKQLKINKFISNIKQLKINKFISKVKQLKMSKFIKSIWQLIISTLNATLEIPSLRHCLLLNLVLCSTSLDKVFFLKSLLLSSMYFTCELHFHSVHSCKLEKLNQCLIPNFDCHDKKWLILILSWNSCCQISWTLHNLLFFWVAF